MGAKKLLYLGNDVADVLDGDSRIDFLITQGSVGQDDLAGPVAINVFDDLGKRRRLEYHDPG